MTTLFTNSAVEIKLDDAEKIIIADWKHAVNIEAWKEANEALINAHKAHEIELQIGDLRNSSMITKEHQDIIKNEIEPKLFEAGLRYTAFVLPEKVFVEMSSKAIVQNLQSGLIVKQFKSLEAAQEWLMLPNSEKDKQAA